MVDFCNKCDAIIIGKKGENIVCSSCGSDQKTKSTISLGEKIEKKKEVEIVNTDDSAEIHPITKETCPKCGCEEAYYWTKQMRAADEPETQFFKCTECKNQWRDYR